MRLNQDEISAIKKSIYQFDPQAEVYLFGSRVDDKKRGGDIDLFVKSFYLTQQDAYTIKELIWDEIGEQKIDIIVGWDQNTPFLRVALKESVRL
jgi:predicted nucleotidyltransferase